MIRRTFESENCAVARSLDVIGDGWSMMILRECFLGARRFGDFERVLDISKNVLTQRLQHLVDHEILQRVDAGTHGKRYEYVLTPKGKDLLTVITALRQWGDRWIFGEGNEPILVIDRRTGEPIERVRIQNAEGRPLHPKHLALEPGPGASTTTLARFAQHRDSGDA